MNVSFIVGERPFRLRVKGRWLRGSVGALAARVLAAHGGGLRVEDCCLRLDGAPVAPGAVADAALSIRLPGPSTASGPRGPRRIILFLNREKVTGRRRP